MRKLPLFFVFAAAASLTGVGALVAQETPAASATTAPAPAASTEAAKPADTAAKPADAAKPAAAANAKGERPGRGGQRDPQARLQQMKETLQLTDEQTTKIQAIFAANREKAKEAREKGEDRAARRDAMKATMDEVNAVLTPEQQTKWKAEIEKRRAERGGKKK